MFAADELDREADALARRIARHPPGVIRAVKGAVDSASGQLGDGLAAENAQLPLVYPSDIAVDRAAHALEAGAQTLAGEKRLETLLQSL